MSAAFTPEPDDRRDPRDGRDAGPVPSGHGCLSDRDKRILDDIAGHETGADPTFAARLTSRSRPVGAATERLIQILAVAAVVAVLLPAQWRLTALMIGLFLIGPVLVTWYGFHAGRSGDDGSGPPPAGPF